MVPPIEAHLAHTKSTLVFPQVRGLDLKDEEHRETCEFCTVLSAECY